MAKYIARRLVYALLLAIFVSFLVFLVYNALPIDKAADMAMQEIAANKNLIYEERYLYWQRKFKFEKSRLIYIIGLPLWHSGKESAPQYRRCVGSVPGSERSSEEGNGKSLQYSCLENSTDRSLVGYSS